MRFPSTPGTTLFLDDPAVGEALPQVRHVAFTTADAEPRPADERPGCPLLTEHSRGDFLRPGLAGHRLVEPTPSDPGTGRSWSSLFRVVDSTVANDRWRLVAKDADAGLSLVTEVEALPGGPLRIRHTLTNDAAGPYLLEELSVSVPLPDDHAELLDFTGRHERERSPQRQPINDGSWLRESRTGKPGCESANLLVTGTPGFGFGHGRVIGMAVAWSGNSRLGVVRGAQGPARLIGGELLRPGEVTLARGESYSTPWVFVVAADDGLDGIAAALHSWQRQLPSNPGPQPATLNVWEAVYFDHDTDKLTELATRAARAGMERFVLDDGWFHLRRDDHAGLGDWWVDPEVWPQGLTPLADTVHGLGMKFGLWFEPEMVNPDSDLFRNHPEWVLQPSGRLPVEHRNQQVLDLTHQGAWTTVRDQIDAVLSSVPVDFVKWDHNRELLEAGTTARGGAPAIHAQTTAYLRLLDDLRSRHPDVVWESCAAGGGRIDLGTIEHVQRFWTSDMTDALARQQIQRWTAQLVAPEYLGAHISSPTSHQTHRTLGLDFRAGTALFGSFGVEWDLTAANEEELDRIAAWTKLYAKHRELLHRGRMFRCDLTEPAVYGHGVVVGDGTEAIAALVQLDEPVSNRGVTLRIPGLQPGAAYRIDWLGPVDAAELSYAPGLHPDGPLRGHPIAGAALADTGVWLPRRRPESVTLLHITQS